jgi:hypothetical protein
MKNLKLIKEYYTTLSTKGKAVFLLGAVVAVYVILEVVS